MKVILNVQRILYLMQKEFRQIFREKANLGIIFVMPFLQLVILGFAITMDVKNIDMVIVDHDRSAYSQRITEAFSANRTFRYLGNAADEKAAIKLLDTGRIKLCIVIPSAFEKDLNSRAFPDLQILVDGVDGNSAGIALGYATIVIKSLQEEQLKIIARGVTGTGQIVNLQPRMFYNPNLESKQNVVPGIVAILLSMITMILTAINIVREREKGTMEQLLVTPIRNYELILGKVLPFAILGLILFSIGLLSSGLIFGIWPIGNIFLLYFFALIFMMTTLGLGILVSTVAQTQQQAIFIVWFFALASILLSGFFIPIENMPDWVQWITYLNPVRYFMEIVRGIYLKGSGLLSFWQELVIMTIYSVTVLSFAIMRFKKRLS
ncbi:MAG: ABC transporter permease [Candidatus Margulisiibacteriota bacterium]